MAQPVKPVEKKTIPVAQRMKNLRQRFRGSFKEIKRSSWLVALSAPAVAGAFWLHFTPPATQNVEQPRAKAYVESINAGISSDRAKSTKPSVVDDYTVDTWVKAKNLTPSAFGENTYSFLYHDPVSDELRLVHLNRTKAVKFLGDAIDSGVQERLADIYVDAIQRKETELGIGHDYSHPPFPDFSKKIIVPMAGELEVGGAKVMKYTPNPHSAWGWITLSDGREMDFSHYVAELMLSGKLNPEDFFNEHEKARFREALSQIDSKEFNVLLKKYESVAGRLNLGSRSIATLLLLMVAAGNLSLAAHQFMREKKQKGGVDLDGALKRLTRQGKVPSPAEVLKEAGVPAAYAALLGLSRSGAGWDVKKWFAQNAAESGLKGGTRRDVRRAQPLKPEQLVSYLADCMLKRQRPLLYGFWGGHKENESGFADEHDETALTNLKKTVDAMSQQGLKPPKMKLIFADKHSQDFNGIPSDKTERYYRSISRLAKKHGFELVRLSDLYGDRTWRKFAPQVRVLSDEHAERLLKNPELRRTLSASAQKHSTLIEDGKASVDQVVEKYVRERVFEGFMLSLHPKWQGIHWTYSDPKLNELLPRVPTLFLHSIARSTSASPWFLDAAKPARHSPVQERREAA